MYTLWYSGTLVRRGKQTREVWEHILVCKKWLEQFILITNWILSKSRIYTVWIFWFRMSIMETALSKCSTTTVESCTSPSTGMMTAISFQGLAAPPRSVHYSFDKWLLLFLSNCIKCKLDIVTVIREKIINPFPGCLWICPKFILLWVVWQIYP